MLKIVLLVLLVVVIIFLVPRLLSNSHAAPAPGSMAPDFSLASQEGTSVSLKDYRGKWVVLYFYPKDQTPGCTREAHNFQVDQAKYDQRNSVILGVSAGERRISLGLKQALGDPWVDVAQKFAVGSAVEGPVTSLTNFGAFVQLSEGIEGMIHVSDMSAEKRINHPQDMLKIGQSVKAQVLEVDAGKRRLKLGIKQLVPTSIEEYIAERREGSSPFTPLPFPACSRADPC